MTTHPIRVYADTSVYGGIADEEFAEATDQFFDLVKIGHLALVLSAVVRDELAAAPQQVRTFFDEIRPGCDFIEVSEASIALHEAYLAAGIVGPKSRTDALHVALATVAQCRLIVSWNFRHIVNFEKIPLYNGVNLSKGYAAMAIHSPLEVWLHEEDEEV